MKSKVSKKIKHRDAPKKTKKNLKKKNDDTEADVADILQGSCSESEDEGLIDASKMSKKQYLEKLKENDPEFYKAVMASEDLELDSDDEIDEDNDDAEDQVFKPPKELEEQDVDSDEEMEDEEMTETTGGNTLSPAMIDVLREALNSSNPLNAFRDMEQALLAAIESLGGHDDGPNKSKFRLEGPQMFNAVVRLCLQSAAPALQRIFRLKNIEDDPAKSKKWGKLKNFIKPYLRHMVKLTEAIAEPEVAVVVLRKGILPVLNYYIAHPQSGKLLVKRLVVMWSTSHQRVRVLAFVAIFRLTRSLKTELLDPVLKNMYLSYVKNCRFTTPSTWGMIDFMRTSLVELYALDRPLAYRHAFLYIRQMAMHLRNAILVKKQEKIQLVYNWQYIHCLHLWSAMLCRTHPDTILEPLIYPLTQIAIGTIKLQNSAKFYPLVFHVCGILSDLSAGTDTFIPVLPFLLDVINNAQLNKKHKQASLKPFQWICMLKLSKSQMSESAFKDGVVDQVYDHVLRYLNVEAASIGFPELTTPAVFQLKTFIKNSKNGNYSKKIKQLLEKIHENSKFVTDRRKEIQFAITDFKAVKDWEISTRQAGTPIGNYYEQWKKSNKKNILKQISSKDEMDDYGLPVIKKRELQKKENNEKTGFDDVFGSDEEDSESEEESRFLTKKEKASKRKREDLSDAEVDDDEMEVEDSEDDEEEEENSDEYDMPPSKKNKKAVKESAIEDKDDGVEVDNSESNDVVREMNFSDLEEEDSDIDDEFEEEDSGEESDEDSS